MAILKVRNKDTDEWEEIEAIKGDTGPQGIQGPQGEQGEQGKQGIPGNDGADGTDGEDGFSPIIETSKSGKTTTLTITDAEGTKTATILDGEDGSSSVAWGDISGTLSNQTDLKNALDDKANSSSLSTVATSGSYSDLSNKPTIPDELADLSDDSTHRVVTDTEKTTWSGKQDALVSGTNIKTINNESLLGSGNITIQGGGGTATDVQVNGTSITSSGVANLITNTAYDGSSNKIATMSDLPTVPTPGNAKTYYGTSDTSASTQEKTVTCSGFTLEEGATIFVKFKYANTYNGTATLNVNNTGAVDIARVGSTRDARYFWNAGELVGFSYDGMFFTMLNKGGASTTYYGITKLNQAVNSTSTLEAATPSAVKLAYDLAFGRQEKLVSGTNIKTINNTSLLGSGNITVGGGTATDVQINGTSIVSSDVANILTNTAYDSSTNKIATMNDLPTVPTKVSDLTNDAGYLASETDPVFTASDAYGISSTDISNWNAKSDFSGSYNDLTDKPTIPSKVSDLTNDAGYTTNTGTITSVKMNGSTVSSSGEADLGTVLTSHQNIKTINSTSLVGTGDVTVQPTLVSGTNIKTINNTSLLGSGDISVSTFSGSYNDLSNKPAIPDELADLSDDSTHRVVTDTEKTTWSGKQDALVSGTNIKTINNTSILGSGDISVGSEKLPIGSIKLYAGSTAPDGYLFCDGSAVSRTTYSDLFTVIGTTYGSGDGSTTFNLPNLKGKVAVGYDSADSDFDTLGETSGEKTHTLTVDEMPSHSHNFKGTAPNRTATTSSTTLGYGIVYNSSATTAAYNIATGGGEAHNNLQPYITLNYIIKASDSSMATLLDGQVHDGYNTSTLDSYSCNYINNAVKETYSKSEIVVGTWWDNKPIYRKVVTGTLPSLQVSSGTVEGNVAHGISNIDTVVNVYGELVYSDSHLKFPILSSNGKITTIRTVTSTNIVLRASDSWQAGPPVTFVLEYTKTTD